PRPTPPLPGGGKPKVGTYARPYASIAHQRLARARRRSRGPSRDLPRRGRPRDDVQNRLELRETGAAARNGVRHGRRGVWRSPTAVNFLLRQEPDVRFEVWTVARPPTAPPAPSTPLSPPRREPGPKQAFGGTCRNRSRHFVT